MVFIIDNLNITSLGRREFVFYDKKAKNRQYFKAIWWGAKIAKRKLISKTVYEKLIIDRGGITYA